MVFARNTFLLLLLCLHAQLAFSQNPDIDLLRSIHQPAPQRSDQFFRFISQSVTPLALAVPLTHAGLGLTGRKNRCEKLHTLLEPMAGIFTPMLVSTGLKSVINRERPFVRYSGIQAKTAVSTHSFPSGHTTAAFATATTLALRYKKWYVWVPAYAWATTVGWSRLHLGVHYPTDVLGGALLGTLGSWACYRLTQKWIDRRAACRPVEIR